MNTPPKINLNQNKNMSVHQINIFSKFNLRRLSSGNSVAMYQFAHLFPRSTLRQKCPNKEFFWSVFSCIQTEYGDSLRKSPYSVRIQENTHVQNLGKKNYGINQKNQAKLERTKK